MLKVGIVTVSDRASRGDYEDLGGPAVQGYLAGALADPATFVTRLVPDERESIEAALAELCDREECSLVVTTGGTGPAVRDVTPDATRAVSGRELPGFGEAMRTVSLRTVPTAILSRQTAGTRGRALIVNLPGRPQAIAECLDAVILAIPDCIALLDGPRVGLVVEAPDLHRDGA